MKSLGLVDWYRELAEDPQVMEISRTKDTAFTRKREGGMGFSDALCLLLDLCKTTLQTRLNRFYINEKGGEPIKQPSFTKLRANFDHTPFELMVRETVEEEYSGRYELPTWRGFHVLANDGSYLQLPGAPALAEAFGVRGGGNRPSAGISVLYDLLHGWVIDPIITRTDMNERGQLKKHVDYLCGVLPDIAAKTLLLLDRGYPSQEIFAKLEEESLHFCARCKHDFTVDVRDAPLGSSTVTLKSGQTLRVVKFLLSSGETETLLTNLFDLPEADFPALYAMRWGVETLYHTLKKKVGVEQFSGRTENSVYQDFWASMALLNVAATFQKEADEELAKRHEGKLLKHSYRARNSDLIVTLRDRFIFASLCGNRSITDREYGVIMRQLASSVSPLRPGRSFPRAKRPFASANHFLKSRL
jgi:hypothetical protein